MDPSPKAGALGQCESCGLGLLFRYIYLAIDMFKFQKKKKKARKENSLSQFIFFNKLEGCYLKKP